MARTDMICQICGKEDLLQVLHDSFCRSCFDSLALKGVTISVTVIERRANWQVLENGLYAFEKRWTGQILSYDLGATPPLN